MNFRKLSFSLIFIGLLGFTVQAQSVLSAADKLYAEGKFDKAVKAYEKMAEKGEEFPYDRLADSYRLTGDTKKAEDWYKKAIDKAGEKEVDPEVHLNYAKMLQSNGKYQAAIDEYLLYGKLSGPEENTAVAGTGDDSNSGTDDNENGVPGDTPPPDKEKEDPRIISFSSGTDDNSEERGTMILPKYRVRAVSGLNTEYNDYLTEIFGSTVVFSSREDNSASKKKKKDKKKKLDFNFYTADREGDENFLNIAAIKGNANSKYDDFWAVYAPGREFVYFTRTNAINPTNGEAQGAQIYFAQVKKGKWKKAKPLFDSPKGNTNAYPAMHPTGNLIIFASDREGGFGGMDLWISRKEGENWGEPVNLGPNINTAGNESFPTINRQGILFFGSDGHPGFGGLDIFSAVWKQNKWQDLKNLGYGLNSADNDFGIVWDPGKSSGFFISDRSGGTGGDVYFFKRAMEMIGTITEETTGRPVPNASLVLTNPNGKKSEAWTDAGGNFMLYIEPNLNYRIAISAEGYNPNGFDFPTAGIPQGEDLERDFTLEINRMYQLSGKIVDADSGDALPGGTIQILNDGDLADETYEITPAGTYEFKIVNNDQFDVIFMRENYVPQILHLSLDEFNGFEKETRNIKMKPGDHVLVSGKVISASGKRKPLSNATIHIVDNNTQTVIDSGYTSRYGVFRFALPWDSLSNYSVISSKEGFLAASEHLDSRYDQDVHLDLEMEEADYGLAKVLKVINYEYNQAMLDILSKKDLNEIFYFMISNPDAKLEVRSHTDSRGSKNYNRVLSFKRSDAVIDFIRSRKELPEDRFISRGFGEEMLINDCDDENVCGEEDHAKNRRTEIFILDH